MRARPLTDQAKEALFNILREKVQDRVFLDLFAGSGAVGIEALSRGARKAVFVELNRKAVAVIHQNLAETGLAGGADVYAKDVLRALKLLARNGEKFDVVFLGAPYDSPALEKALEIIGAADMLREGGILVAEHRRQHRLQEAYGGLKLFRETRYGETVLSFYLEEKPNPSPSEMEKGIKAE